MSSEWQGDKIEIKDINKYNIKLASTYKVIHNLNSLYKLTYLKAKTDKSKRCLSTDLRPPEEATNN